MFKEQKKNDFRFLILLVGVILVFLVTAFTTMSQHISDTKETYKRIDNYLMKHQNDYLNIDSHLISSKSSYKIKGEDTIIEEDTIDDSTEEVNNHNMYILFNAILEEDESLFSPITTLSGREKETIKSKYIKAYEIYLNKLPLSDKGYKDYTSHKPKIATLAILAESKEANRIVDAQDKYTNRLLKYQLGEVLTLNTNYKKHKTQSNLKDLDNANTKLSFYLKEFNIEDSYNLMLSKTNGNTEITSEGVNKQEFKLYHDALEANKAITTIILTGKYK